MQGEVERSNPPPGRRRAAAARALLIASAWLLVALYYVGLIPSMATFAFDYTRNIPITEVLPAVFSRSPSELLHDPYTSAAVCFIPLALTVSLAFGAVRQTGAKVALATIALLLPLLGVYYTPTMFVFLPLMSPVAVGGLVGWCDGETWSEGFVAKGALGAWMIQWAAVLVTLWVRLRRRRLNQVGFAVLVDRNAPTRSTRTTSSASPTPSPTPAAPSGRRTSA